MYPNPYPPPRRRNTGLWIALGLAVLAIGTCLCAGGLILILFWPLAPVRATPPPPTVIVRERPTATPTHLPPLPTLPPPTDMPTATPALAPPAPPTATPAEPETDDVEPFIPDLSGVTSAAFTFSRTDGRNQTEGTGQLIWPEQSVYEIGDALYLAEEGQLLYWNDDLDGWVEALPSARLHDNLVYWLRLLSFGTPDSAAREQDGRVFGFFSFEVPQEENVFGVRDLHGSGWFRWDPARGELSELAFDMVYKDRLGTSINEIRYMAFESWGEPVVIPERPGE